jgi:hypothetical protein
MDKVVCRNPQLMNAVFGGDPRKAVSGTGSGACSLSSQPYNVEYQAETGHFAEAGKLFPWPTVVPRQVSLYLSTVFTWLDLYTFTNRTRDDVMFEMASGLFSALGTQAGSPAPPVNAPAIIDTQPACTSLITLSAIGYNYIDEGGFVADSPSSVALCSGDPRKLSVAGIYAGIGTPAVVELKYRWGSPAEPAPEEVRTWGEWQSVLGITPESHISQSGGIEVYLTNDETYTPRIPPGQGNVTESRVIQFYLEVTHVIDDDHNKTTSTIDSPSLLQLPVSQNGATLAVAPCVDFHNAAPLAQGSQAPSSGSCGGDPDPPVAGSYTSVASWMQFTNHMECSDFMTVGESAQDWEL